MIIELENTHVTLSLVRASRELYKLSANLQVINNCMRPTLEFLRSVADWMELQGLRGATLTAAWQLWKAVSDSSYLARTQQEPNAEVAYWFGIDPSAITETQQLGLLENLPKLIAQERIYHGNYSPSDPSGVFSLFMAAFDDEPLARKAQLEAAKRMVEAATKRLN